MDEQEILKVASVLNTWNPLGDRAIKIADLDGYRAEAIEIIYNSGLRKNAKVSEIIMEVINEAFDLSLSESDCVDPARKINEILKRKA
jgi:uncharacterized phosphosugar-binding protein